MWRLVLLLCLIPWSSTLAQGDRQAAIDNAITAAERVCLVGSRYKFSMDVSGKLTIMKIVPGADVKTTIDAAKATGGVLFEREDIRQLVDADIRKCMSDQWPRVLNALEGKSSEHSVVPRATVTFEPKEDGEISGPINISTSGGEAFNLGFEVSKYIMMDHECGGGPLKQAGPFLLWWATSNMRQKGSIILYENELWNKLPKYLKVLNDKGLECVKRVGYFLKLKVEYEDQTATKYARYYSVVAVAGLGKPWHSAIDDSSASEWKASTSIKSNLPVLKIEPSDVPSVRAAVFRP